MASLKEKQELTDELEEELKIAIETFKTSFLEEK